MLEIEKVKVRSFLVGSSQGPQNPAFVNLIIFSGGSLTFGTEVLICLFGVCNLEQAKLFES